MNKEMKRDIKSIMVLLATQGMINLGEIKNPVTSESNLNIPGAEIFIQLLDVLKEKTKGNLTEDEDVFLSDLLSNLNQVLEKKKDAR